MRNHPHLYEINTCVFIKRMSHKYGRLMTLATIPDEEWQLLASLGFDFVWLMGVWQRSPGSRQKALMEPTLRREYGKALPGWSEDDVDSSPYAVYSYGLNPLLGASAELAQLKSKLNQQGLRLILDFVPNHLALDHPWTVSHPTWFVQGKKADAHTHPDRFFTSEQGIYFAHGREPHFPPWTDTVQSNFYSNEMRQALINELLGIAELADGVRCDMAMLALNDVFERIWGKYTRAYQQPDTEFWIEAITRVKERRPQFLFIAEVYWGLERRLQDMGFDYTYDKPFYDKLRFSSPQEICDYLKADDSYSMRSVRFIENHDEIRAVAAFGRERSLAAAVVLSTVPGFRLFHDGQLEGRRVRLPIQLVRQPEEAADAEVAHFYERLLTVCNSPDFHEGEWRLLGVSQSGESNDSHLNILAWYWRYGQKFKTVVVNYSPEHAQGWMKLPLSVERAEKVKLRDQLSGRIFVHNAEQPGSQGLYLDLKPWEAQILEMHQDPDG